MTETEKNHGLPIKINLPKGFLEDEIRYDYLVSKQMKEVWAVELDLLNELNRVCKKHNLTYFADGGTILGAIRHHGYIPWDDDLDITLMRADYIKLCEVASEFKEPYFFQTEQTDPGSLRGHAQLRNSWTTGALSYETKHCWFNQGIFIDIFPIDNVTDDKDAFDRQRKEIIKQKHRAKFFGREIGNYEGSKGLNKAIKLIFNPILSIGNMNKIISKNAYDKFEELCQKYNVEKTRKCSLLCHQADWDRLIRDRDDYKYTIMTNFEFIEIPLPNGYENVLHNLYGDYMKIIKGDTSHGGIIFETRTPYTVYLNKHFGNKYY